MNNNFSKKISKNFQRYDINQIKSGASKKSFYRLGNGPNSYILTNFNKDKEEYRDYINVYNLLKKINISIPKILEKNDKELITISEDLGEKRFDKIIENYHLKDLLNYAVKTLIVIKNSIKFDLNNNMPKYSILTFESEIMELPEYYFSHIKLDNPNLIKEFSYIWLSSFQKFNFEFKSFVHKDYNINNLIMLPSKKDYLKCGVIDFQNAFWGESSWDLFSLLEESRILFSNEHNNYFIRYFYEQTNNKDSFQEFVNKYYFLSSSRQTRLLGRWVKLAKEKNQDWYLEFIPITLQRLKKSINLTNNKNLINFYNKYIFN